MALITRARVEVLTTLALLSTRETVAVETLARRATCSRFMFITLYKENSQLTGFTGEQAVLIALTRELRPNTGMCELTEQSPTYINGQCLGYQCLPARSP